MCAGFGTTDLLRAIEPVRPRKNERRRIAATADPAVRRAMQERKARRLASLLKRLRKPAPASTPSAAL